MKVRVTSVLVFHIEDTLRSLITGKMESHIPSRAQFQRLLI